MTVGPEKRAALFQRRFFPSQLATTLTVSFALCLAPATDCLLVSIFFAVSVPSLVRLACCLPPLVSFRPCLVLPPFPPFPRSSTRGQRGNGQCNLSLYSVRRRATMLLRRGRCVHIAHPPSIFTVLLISSCLHPLRVLASFCALLVLSKSSLLAVIFNGFFI